MLTRLRVSGFKNLADVDVRFGPFTCIAGQNAVGKSNLFDAVHFLSRLADDTFMNAALSVRASAGPQGDVRSLFRRVGDRHVEQMSFEAELVLPRSAVDDLGQQAEATITLVRYRLALGYRRDAGPHAAGALELLDEELDRINLGAAGEVLTFPHSIHPWRRSVLHGRRSSSFIATGMEDGRRIVRLSQDSRQGRPKSFLAANLPRSILSTVNAGESPTALVVRREMQSWRQLQLEPSALRRADTFTTPPGLRADGSHLPATLYHMASGPAAGQADDLYDRLGARLAQLIDNVGAVRVVRDEARGAARELLTLELTERDGSVFPARSLSDGTLRFLALAVLEQDPGATGLICLEEPENGIHPLRIPAIARLLKDIACDVERATGPDNPLRQVIVNTHSPALVSLMPDDVLLVAGLKESVREGAISRSAHFGWLPETWRAQAAPAVAPVLRDELLTILDPTALWQQLPAGEREATAGRHAVEPEELQLTLPFGAANR